MHNEAATVSPTNGATTVVTSFWGDHPYLRDSLNMTLPMYPGQPTNAQDHFWWPKYICKESIEYSRPSINNGTMLVYNSYGMNCAMTFNPTTSFPSPVTLTNGNDRDNVYFFNRVTNPSSKFLIMDGASSQLYWGNCPFITWQIHGEGNGGLGYPAYRHKNGRAANVLFFDGHAETLPVSQIARDLDLSAATQLWGAYN